MATFKVIFLSKEPRKDGTMLAYVQVIHNRKVGRINTNIYVPISEIDSNLALKDGNYSDTLNSLIRRYREKLYALSERLSMDSLTVTDIIKYLSSEENNKVIDFYKVIAAIIMEKEKANTKQSYKTVLFSLLKFTGKDVLDINDITTSFLQNYEKWLRDNKLSSNSIFGYLMKIKKAFKYAIFKFNDPDKGIFRVKYDPFDRFLFPRRVSTNKKAIEVSVLHIFRYELSDDKTYAANMMTNRVFVIARDMFLLSFYLCGINLIDIYNMKKSCFDGVRLNYCRTKTKDARIDKAFTSIKVQPEAMRIMKKYMSDDGDRLFSFDKRYSSHRGFVNAVGLGMGVIRKIINIQNLTYYSARHTWATIARNNINVDISDIALCLNHASPFRVTDGYIKTDWNRIDDINRKVIDYVFPDGEISYRSFDSSIRVKSKGAIEIKDVSYAKNPMIKTLEMIVQLGIPRSKVCRTSHKTIFSDMSVFNHIHQPVPGRYNSERVEDDFEQINFDDIDITHKYTGKR